MALNGLSRLSPYPAMLGSKHLPPHPFFVVLEIQPRAASVSRSKHLPYIPRPLVDAEVGSPRRSGQSGPHSGNQAVLLTTGTSAMSQQDISNHMVSSEVDSGWCGSELWGLRSLRGLSIGPDRGCTRSWVEAPREITQSQHCCNTQSAEAPAGKTSLV